MLSIISSNFSICDKNTSAIINPIIEFVPKSTAIPISTVYSSACTDCINTFVTKSCNQSLYAFFPFPFAYYFQ